MVDLMGLDAVAVATGIGWVIIVIMQVTIFVLERKGIWPKKQINA